METLSVAIRAGPDDVLWLCYPIQPCGTYSFGKTSAEPTSPPDLAEGAGTGGYSPHGRVTSSVWSDIGSSSSGGWDARILRGAGVLGRSTTRQGTYNHL
jgi:hypothetical protein